MDCVKSITGVCNSIDFKSDISQLCELCPLREPITNGIIDQIFFQANEKKQVMSSSQFQKYLDDEVVSAEKAMEKAHLVELQNPGDDIYRVNRIKIYIWNKERIKALNSFVLPGDVISETIEDKEDFKQPAYGLYHAYASAVNPIEGPAINGVNAAEIAYSYNYKSPNSGVSLKGEFVKFANYPETRVTPKGDRRGDRSHLKHLEDAIILLKRNNCVKALELAEKELSEFKKNARDWL